MIKNIPEDKRLLEILDCIDDKYIFEVAEDYEVLDIPGEYRPNKRRVRKAYAVALIRAACVVLLAGIVAMVPQIYVYISNSIPSGTHDIISEDEYYENYHDPDWEYYGKYGNCYASLPKGSTDVTSSETVGEFTFVYDSDTAMKIFYEENFYTLEEAYNREWLTVNNLQDIYLYHTDILSVVKEITLTPNTIPIELYEYEVNTIMYYYLAEWDKLNGDHRLHASWSVDCLLDENGIYAFSAFCKDVAYINVPERRIVGNYDFGYSSYIILCEGKVYTMKDAYESGILTEKLLDVLYNRHLQYKTDYYGANYRPPEEK